MTLHTPEAGEPNLETVMVADLDPGDRIVYGDRWHRVESVREIAGVDAHDEDGYPAVIETHRSSIYTYSDRSIVRQLQVDTVSTFPEGSAR